MNHASDGLFPFINEETEVQWPKVTWSMNKQAVIGTQGYAITNILLTALH